LEAKGIQIAAHITAIGGITDEPVFLDPVDPDLDAIGTDFPVLNKDAGLKMQEAIAAAHAEGDSVGGLIECVVTGLPAGIGDPMFDGMESRIARIVYGIPAVKGLEFGSGFVGSYMRGSENNDPFTIKDGIVRTATNNAGGILGGITTGMPLIFQVAIKPTPSIAMEQETVNISTMQTVNLQIGGRHDPCIVPRAVPVIEAAAAIAIYDAILSNV
jgi:chorismate synthase